MASYKNKDVFTLSSVSVILCECFYNIVCIFVDTFFISRILSVTSYSIYYIGLFYFAMYCVRIFLSYGLNFLIKKVKLNYFVTIGAIIMIALVLSVYFLNDSMLVSYIPLLGACYSLGSAFFCIGITNLATVAVSSRYQVRFFTTKRTAVIAIQAIAPVILGATIVGVGANGFKLVAILMSVFTVLLFVFSMFIKQNKKFTMSYKISSFIKEIRKNEEDRKTLKPVYWVSFCTGFTFTVFSVMFTYLIAMNLKNDLYLGTTKTIVTIGSVITLLIFLKSYRKRHAKWYTFLPMILIPVAGIVMMFWFNSYTIIAFYAVYRILTVNVGNLIDMRRAGVIRLINKHEHILEHNALYEIIVDSSRILGFGLCMIVGVIDSYIALYVLIAILLISLIADCLLVYIVEKRLIDLDKEWKKTHIAVSDSTTPSEKQEAKAESK